MSYSEILQYFQNTSLLRGDVFFGVAVLCFLVLIVFVIVYGDTGSYKVDPDNPDVMKNHKHEMQRDVFARYYSITGTILTICLLSSVIGLIQYFFWKYQDVE